VIVPRVRADRHEYEHAQITLVFISRPTRSSTRNPLWSYRYSSGSPRVTTDEPTVWEDFLPFSISWFHIKTKPHCSIFIQLLRMSTSCSRVPEILQDEPTDSNYRSLSHRHTYPRDS